jgi:GT2 family glycosyltransferase
VPNADTPAASVVVATFNRPDHVRTCLEHLSEQTSPPLEIVVVDSSPHRLTESVVADFPRVRYVRNDRGPGTLATSRAIGLSVTTGEVIAFVDDDAYAHPTWLHELLLPYSDPLVGAVGGRARNGMPGEESVGLDEIGQFRADGTLSGNFSADPGRNLVVDHVIGANFSVRRTAIDGVGGIRDYYPGTCLREESDIALRLTSAGHEIVYAPRAVVDHVAGTYAKGKRFDLRYDYYGHRNHAVLLTTTIGLRDARTQRYMRATARNVFTSPARAVRSLSDPDRPTLVARGRGAGREIARGSTQLIATGVGVANGLVLRRRDRRM